MIENGHK